MFDDTTVSTDMSTFNLFTYLARFAEAEIIKVFCAIVNNFYNQTNKYNIL